MWKELAWCVAVCVAGRWVGRNGWVVRLAARRAWRGWRRGRREVVEYESEDEAPPVGEGGGGS